MANFDGTPLVGALTNDPLSPDIKTQQAHYYRVDDGNISGGKFIDTDSTRTSHVYPRRTLKVATSSTRTPCTTRSSTRHLQWRPV